MAGLAKTRTALVASAESPSTAKPQTIHQQRRIPTRIHRNDDKKLDVNRNPQPSSLNNSTNCEFSSSDNDTCQNGNFDNERDKHGKTEMLKHPASCLSVPVNSLKPLRRTNSPKRASECDARSRLTYSPAPCNENEVSKYTEKGKPSSSAVDAAKPQCTNKKNIESSNSFVNNHASYRSPSRISHSKPLLSNKSNLSKNLNKISSGNEVSAVKSVDSGFHVKSALSGNKISRSADHLTPHEAQGTVQVEMSSNNSSVISSSVKKPDLKLNSTDVLINGMPSPSTVFGKRNLRSRTKTPNSEPRANFRPRSSGPLVVSHRKTRGSASNEQSPLRKDSRKLNENRKSSESFALESSEGELGFNRGRKGIGTVGHKTGDLNEQDEKTLHVSNIQKIRFAARSQKLLTGQVGKFDRTMRNSDTGTNSIVSSKKNDPQGQSSVSRPSVWKIHDSPELSAPESRQDNILSDTLDQANEPVTCKTSDALNNDEEACQAQRSFHDGKKTECACDLNGCLLDAGGHSATGFDGHLDLESCDDAVRDSVLLEFDRCHDEEKPSVELGDVVMDAETFRQITDELETLKSTVLHLQRVLLQVGTGEGSICDNGTDDTSASVKMECSVQNEIALSSLHPSAICQENQELRKQVDDLEKLKWEQRKIIDSLKQNLNSGVGCQREFLRY